MSSDGKKRELATNRLLDILRSQQSNIGKQESKPPVEQKKELITEPDSSEEPDKKPDTQSKLSILIPDPNRFGTKSTTKPFAIPKVEKRKIPESVPEEVQTPQTPLSESDSTDKESILSEPPNVQTPLENSPGLNALRKKLGLIKKQQSDKKEDNQPENIFNKPVKDIQEIEKSEEKHVTVNDLLKVSKKPIKSDKTPSDTKPEKPIKEEKPLSEFFKRGSAIGEKSDKKTDKSKNGGVVRVFRPVTPDRKVDTPEKKQKPLNEFFKRGSQLGEQEDQKSSTGSKVLFPDKSEIKPDVRQKTELSKDTEKKIPVPPIKSADSHKRPIVKPSSPDKDGSKDIEDKTIITEGEETSGKVDVIADIKPETKEIKIKKKPGLFSFLKKLKFISKNKTQEETEIPARQETEISEPVGKNTVSDIAPVSFNDSLITFLEVEDYNLTLKDHLNTFIQRFDESGNKLAIVTDEQTLLLLLVSRGIRGLTVENYQYFTIPYVLPGRTIKNSHDLLNYVLSEVVTEKQKKILYGTYFSTKIQSKTQVLQTPELSRKELADLVDWNSKKNLSFPADQGISNWEINRDEDKSKKREVVIGVIDSKSINTIYNTFNRNNVKLRFTCTLPILLWKTFIKNYPDRNNQCNVLVHFGEIHTIVLVISNLKLLFVREIALGTQDFYKSIMQRVEKKDKSTIDIDFDLAKQITHQYGFPKDTKGFTVGTKINLYKLAIFQRPVVERISGELGRSLNYFKKQNPELVWEELVFDGIGATLPNLLETLRDNLNIDVSLLNPIRTSKIHYSNTPPIPKYLLPNFAVNFALVSEEVRNLNLMPKKIRRDHKNILFSKLAGIAVGIFIPFVAISTFLSGLKIDTYTERIKTLEMEKNNTISQTKEYFDLKGDTEILQAYQNYITNDRISTENKITLLKVLSNEVPDEIKITELKFKKRFPNEDSGDPFDPFIVRPEYYIELTGFVLSDVSVANIQLANFRVGLQNKSYFKSIKVLRQDISTSTSGKLLFTMELRY